MKTIIEDYEKDISEERAGRIIKSLLASTTIVISYFFATIGIVNVLWKSEDNDVREGRMKFLGYLLVLGTIVLIFGVYYIFESHPAITMEEYHRMGIQAACAQYPESIVWKITLYVVVWFHIAYLVIGNLCFIFGKRHD